MKIKTKVQSLVEFLTNKKCKNCKHNRGFGCHSSRGKECVLSIFPVGYEKQRITDGLIVEFSESKNKKLIAKQPSRWGLKSQKKGGAELMNDDIKLGYNFACNGLNEDIETMIDVLHDAYMRQTDEKVKDRLDAQIKILWRFKSRIEDYIAKGIGRRGLTKTDDDEKGGEG